jgi:hypothetical protein
MSRHFPRIDAQDPEVRAVAVRRGERGSAYLIALFVLVALTVLGLALVFITQTESQIGANERTVQRVFYAAESAIAIATARVLVANDHRPATFTLAEAGVAEVLNFRNQLRIAAVIPIYDAPCNLCEINNAGTYNEKAYRRINNAITVTATRLGGPEDRRLAQKTIASMLDLQPWKAPLEAYLPMGDESLLSEIRF